MSATYRVIMQNLTDSETFLFIGFFVLCVCVLFVLGMCFRHGFFRKLRHEEAQTETSTLSFSERLYRRSSINVSAPPAAKNKNIWVDTKIKHERQINPPVINSPDK
ncbi:hypothetical protein CCP3SC5AM1_1120009 [Gammaproteobacteria bacterium]